MKFNYLARTKKGEIQTGKIEAVDETAAIKILQNNDLVVVNIKSARQAPFFSKKIKLFERVKKKETVVFSRQLSTLVGADVPLVQSLRVLGAQVKNQFFKESLFQ